MSFILFSVLCRVVRIAPFSNRLAQSVPLNIQALRCLVNYHALRFAEPIRILSDDLVGRMTKKSLLTGGKYVSVHLRFEEVSSLSYVFTIMTFFPILLIPCMFQDMVAFSCCTYDGGWREKTEMDNARERSWRGKFRRHGRVINPEANRRDGKCPLTPLEVSTSYFFFVFVFVYYKHILSLGLLGCTAIVHQLMGVKHFLCWTDSCFVCTESCS